MASPVPPRRAEGERFLILVKHSLPILEPNVPAREWRLGQEGRNRCGPLAEQLSPYRPSLIVTSEEAKAVETGMLVARRLNLPTVTAPGLHEHDRRNVGFLSDKEFEAGVARFFACPDKLILGDETADEASRRFDRAIDDVLRDHRDGNVVVAAHGTVVSLFVAAHAGVEPFDLWRRLGLPSFVVVRLPLYQPMLLVEHVGKDLQD